MKYQKRIYDLRIDNDLTQEDVAKIIKTTKQNYGMIENGKRKLQIEDLIILCKYYDVTADYMLGFTDDPHHNGTKAINITQRDNNTINIK